MKCTGCDNDKSEKEFDWLRKKDGQPKCKACRSKYFKAYYKKNRAKYKKHATDRKEANRSKLMDYLCDKVCIDCKLNDPVVFHFDHIDPKKKSHNVAEMINGFCWESILKEIAKCQVRCSNCHIRRTAKAFNWYKARIV